MRYAFSVIALLLLAMGVLSGCARRPIDRQVPGLLWPEPPQTPRVKLIAAYYNSVDVEGKGSPVMRLLGEDVGMKLNRPHGIVADRSGNIYVSDIGFGSLQLYVFDFTRKKFRVVGGEGAWKLQIPLGLAIDNDRGLLFVADGGHRMVFALDIPTGRVEKVIGQRPGTFQRPASVAVDPRRQRVYVGDTREQTVKVFDYDANFLFSIGKGERSDEDDGFNVPSQLAVDGNGNLYVADMFNRYIKVFDVDGGFVKKIGQGVGLGFGNFSKVTGVALDSEGHIYGLDTDYGNFQIFDQDNNLLLFVGESGTEYGKFYTPQNIFIDEQDRIYVTDTLNQRIQVFQYLGSE